MDYAEWRDRVECWWTLDRSTEAEPGSRLTLPMKPGMSLVKPGMPKSEGRRIEFREQKRAQDHPSRAGGRPGDVLGALAALLEIEGDISVIAQARNGREALTAVWRTSPMSSSRH